MSHFTESVIEQAMLARLRDALLPKLMRGEVRVRPPRPAAPTDTPNEP